MEDTQSANNLQIREELTGKVSEFTEQVNQNLQRVEANLDKPLAFKRAQRHRGLAHV